LPTELFALLDKLKVGDNFPVRSAGVINVGPESFYPGSIRTLPDEILQLAWSHVKNGADIIDVGGASTAPSAIYHGIKVVGVSQELERVKIALKAIMDEDLGVPISVDTQHSKVAEAALSLGASIVNDISGLKTDAKMAKVITDHEASLIIMAAHKCPGDIRTIQEAKSALKESIHHAIVGNVDLNRIVIDPSIGAWGGRDHRIDLMFLKNLEQFKTLEHPIFIAVSRKSFIGRITGVSDPSKRLMGSIAATAIAVFNGCHIVRTHDIKETVEAIRIAEALRDVSYTG